MGKLSVIKFKDGSIIRKSATKEGYGSIMLMSETLDCSGGFVNTHKRIAFLRGEVVQLEAFQLKENDDFNAKLKALNGSPLRIRVIESLTPIYEGHQPKMNPKTQEIIVDENGSPIYYDTELVAENSDLFDVKISTVKSEEIASVSEEGDMS